MIDTMSTLYIVATPIGHLKDITLRAIDTLKMCPVIAAEDTRHARHLLNHYDIHNKLIPLHQHNESSQTKNLIAQLQQGQSIALISDAGTPMISDPGYHLVRACQKAELRVCPIPGPCAAIAALSVAGLPTHQFLFAGFIASKGLAREQQLQALLEEPRTVVLYEAIHRLIDLLTRLTQCLEEDRLIVVARELTKQFETIYQGNAAHILAQLTAQPSQIKGECVVMIAPAQKNTEDRGLDAHTKQTLALLIAQLPLKQAVQLTCQITGASRNDVYPAALALKKEL